MVNERAAESVESINTSLETIQRGLEIGGANEVKELTKDKTIHVQYRGETFSDFFRWDRRFHQRMLLGEKYFVMKMRFRNISHLDILP